MEQTNLYATQCLINRDDIPKFSRVHKWEPTTNIEIKKFLGHIGYMGLVKMPAIKNYWSKSPLYNNDVARKNMSGNRLQILLQMLHFDDNTVCRPGDRLHKILKVVHMSTDNFQALYTPGEVFCIGESMVPFQGRLTLKQYIPQKTHKYGIKLFKLCCSSGCTWNLEIYGGKNNNRVTSLPTDVVFKII